MYRRIAAVTAGGLAVVIIVFGIAILGTLVTVASISPLAA